MSTARYSLVAAALFSSILFGFPRSGVADLARKSFEYAGATRHYLICLPASYPAERFYPLLLLFHGGGGNPDQVLKSSELLRKVEKEDWILVAPAGSGRFAGRLLTWNVGFGFGYAMRNHVDDIGFVRHLIDALKSRYRIDPNRIYATGISNGGILCHLIAARLSDQIAAIAPIVATAGGRAKDQRQWTVPATPDRPVSVIAFNGALDERVPLEGGWQKKAFGNDPVEMWSAKQTIDFWVRNNRCHPSPAAQTNDAKQYRRFTYSSGMEGSEVVQYVLLNQGHAWPGGKKGYRLGDPPSQLVSANDLMFEFFHLHPKKGETAAPARLR
jgi:polyhydroxybutyrate depolymerase